MNRSMALVFFVSLLVLVGCDDFVGPLFSVRIELHGPRESIATEYDGGWDWLYNSILSSGYRCTPILYIRASGSNSASYSDPIVWNGAEIYVYTLDNDLPRQVIGLTPQQLDYVLGYVSAGSNVRTQPLPIVADTIPFRWEMRVLYYDPATGHNDNARFSSRCIHPG